MNLKISKNPKRVGWAPLVIFGAALIFGFYLRSASWLETWVQRPLQRDASDYFNYAYNLRHHHVYSRNAVQPSDSEGRIAADALRSPGYPLFLSLFIDGPPDRQLVKKIQFAQMIVSFLTLIAALFVFRCYLPELWAGSAALLVALSPHLIIFNSYLLTETLFCCLLVLTGLLICRCESRPSISRSLAVGAMMGLATLVRPSLQFFPLALAAVISMHFGRKQGLKLALAMLLGFILILSPWFIRNRITIGKMSDRSLLINFLHHGIYPDFTYQQIPESYRRPYQFDPRSEEIGKNVSSVLAEIKNRFREEPLLQLKWYLFKKPIVFWSWDMIQGHGDIFVYRIDASPYRTNKFFQWSHSLMKILHGPLAGLSLLASLLVWILPPPGGDDKRGFFLERFISVLLLYYTLLHMIGAPFPRYSVPLRPFQYGMALYGIYMIYGFLIAFYMKKTRGARRHSN